MILKTCEKKYNNISKYTSEEDEKDEEEDSFNNTNMGNQQL